MHVSPLQGNEEVQFQLRVTLEIKILFLSMTCVALEFLTKDSCRELLNMLGQCMASYREQGGMGNWGKDRKGRDLNKCWESFKRSCRLRLLRYLMSSCFLKKGKKAYEQSRIMFQKYHGLLRVETNKYGKNQVMMKSIYLCFYQISKPPNYSASRLLFLSENSVHFVLFT